VGAYPLPPFSSEISILQPNIARVDICAGNPVYVLYSISFSDDDEHRP